MAHLRPVRDAVHVAGAGPAGLAAAITLARAGRRVVVHEAHPTVGARFRRDLQGLENWTTREDALDWLQRIGITTAFAALPCNAGTAFDARGRAYAVRSRLPLFYMVERGPEAGSLDAALLAQARALGAEVRFGSRLDRLDGVGVLALGPRAADAIAVGYHFETTMRDGFWVICDDDVAPKGYAYLLVMNSRGTVKSCLFADFKRESLYVERTVAAFERLAGLKMVDPQRHGGVGNFRVPDSALSGGHPLAGEQAGFQDTLWGFGMRFAITSGILAARSVLEGIDYDALWRRELMPWLQASVVNRVLYERCGNAGYAWLLRAQQTAGNARRFLRWLYRPGFATRLVLPWARAHYRSRRRDLACSHADCTCIWCRCPDEYA
ncbi:FAD-binding protein [Betaproteobacteria bacterium PRO7]|nr:FAD-binding protein [Betaproteobacteria bacterium PRO7]